MGVKKTWCRRIKKLNASDEEYFNKILWSDECKLSAKNKEVLLYSKREDRIYIKSIYNKNKMVKKKLWHL
jgi:hypothetical protein